MFFNKKLNEQDLEELRKREELINGFKLVVQSLEVQKSIYLNGVLPKYGCDLNKNYSIDAKTGKIIEVKGQPTQVQPPK